MTATYNPPEGSRSAAEHGESTFVTDTDTLWTAGADPELPAMVPCPAVLRVVMPVEVPATGAEPASSDNILTTQQSLVEVNQAI